MLGIFRKIENKNPDDTPLPHQNGGQMEARIQFTKSLEHPSTLLQSISNLEYKVNSKKPV